MNPSTQNDIDPFITVIITAYKRKDFLLQAIDSVLKQTLNRNKFEIVVVKNYTDDIIDNMLLLNHIKCLLVEECNIGYMLSKAIQLANGSIVCFLDDDDRFEENKLQTIYDLFYNNKEVVYYWNKFTTEPTFIKEKIDNEQILFYKGYNSVLGLGNSIRYNMSSISIRKDNIDAMGLQILNHIESGQDLTLFFLSLKTGGTFAIDNKKLTFYRIHTQSAMHSLKGNDFTRQYRSLNTIENYIVDKPIKNEISKVRIRLQLNSLIFGMHFNQNEIFSLLIDYTKTGIKSRLDIFTILALLLETLNINITNKILKKITISTSRRRINAI